MDRPPSPKQREVARHEARTRARICAALMLALPLVAAHGQYFGRNKVLWERFEFEVLETEHFRVYHYPPGEPAAEDVGRLAERWYERLSALLEHEFEAPNPLIVYQDHADFQQTLTTSGLIGEGTGGFTESLQNRVVLPLTGIQADNDHVLGHELVHAFQFDMMRRRTDTDARSQLAQLPLWLTEGLAEYLSQGREDPQTAMWMRDAVLHDTLPDPQRMGRLELSPYQYGQAIWAYVGGRWGDPMAIRLFTRSTVAGFGAALRELLGVVPEAFLEEVHESLRAAYAPVLDARETAGETARALLHAETTDARLNIAPSLSPDGSLIAFLSTRELFTTDVFLADARTGEIVDRLVSADADPHFDSLSFVDSSVAWSRDGRRLAFTVVSKGERRIAIYDLAGRRVERFLSTEGLKGVRNPAFSPDGRHIAFSATAGTSSDLYMLDIETNELTRLTADRYTAIQPVFSPDGEIIVYVTDRGPGTDLIAQRFGDLVLARLDLQSRRIEPLDLFSRGKHVDPHFSAHGASLYFVAEPDGVPDVFRYDLERREIERLTALKTGVTGITAVSPALSVAANDGAIAFSVLEDGRLNIYRIDAPARRELEGTAATAQAGTLPPSAPDPELAVVQRYLASPRPAELGPGAPPRRPYEPKLGLAFLGPATIGVSTNTYGAGVAGSLSAYFTDTLGRRQLATTLYGGSWGGYLDFEDALGGEIAFLNQSRRLQWGVVGSRVPYITGGTFVSEGTIDSGGAAVPATIVDNVVDIVTSSEISLFGQYPFSLNRRIELSAGARHLSYDRELERLVIPAQGAGFREVLELPAPEALDLRHASAAYVFDTSYFGFVSPLRGTRFRLESEWTTGDLDFRTSLFDYRHYTFRRPLTYAFRAIFAGRDGADAESVRLAPLDVGSDNLVRGYRLGSFDLSECTLTPGSNACPEFDRLLGSSIAVLNFEVRIPVLGSRELGFFEGPAFPIEAFAFVDVGAAWTQNESVDWRFDRDTTDRVPLVSAGIGARILLGGALPLQLYYAVPYQRPEQGRISGVMISTGW